MQTVYVVTDVDLGCDCVVGVFDDYDKAVNACKPNEDDYINDPEFYDSITNDNGMFETCFIHEKTLNA